MHGVDREEEGGALTHHPPVVHPAKALNPKL